MEKSYRIRTNIGQDQVVKAQFKQDIDFLEILSLKIKQSDAYQLHVSNYGMIVGRVLANSSFGIQNAKVSVFIPISDEDLSNKDILNLYPYTSLDTLDKDNIRYNLLPNSSNDDCYRVVGTFPNKRMVLDNNTEIEIFEKYWKYTTVTNQSGDYCIMGVPTGNQDIHVDIDLSDIGILSQKPRDFVYKGYNIEQFDNASQFKESTNLDSLTQIFTQNTSVHVYPFWGEEDVEEVAITRCDMNIAYQFEPTCVFFGSIVSDNFNNNISHKCSPSKKIGFNRNLVAGEGTIEMIRKTTDGLVEEFPIQGNRLIDGNGVWCYQIPMNLDYVGMDEFGNIVPTDNPNKGIATRTSVRFRFSMQETDNDGVSRHRAKYLVPNNFDVFPNSETLKPSISGANKYDQCYEFGSSTPDEFFRDLYWNKVYTVKNYIPRIQKTNTATSQKYTGIKTVNSDGNFNPFPFNHARFRLVFGFRILCVIATIVVKVVGTINKILATLACWRPFDADGLRWLGEDRQPLKGLCGDNIHCISLTQGLTEDSDEDTVFLPNCSNAQNKDCDVCIPKDSSSFEPITDVKYITDIIQDNLSQEYDVVNLDFYNDWVNGVLYFPLWFMKQIKKRKFLFGLITRKAKNKYCDCDKTYNRIQISEICSMRFNDKYYNSTLSSNEIELNSKNAASKHENNIHKKKTDKIKINFGIIKEFINKFDKKIYYYSPGKPVNENYKQSNDSVEFTRLFATDIVLLGSLNACDIDGLPRPYINLPSSTANIPNIYATYVDEEDDDEKVDGQLVESSGLDWMSNYEGNGNVAKYGKGVLMGISCDAVVTLHKTCVNLQRLSELGVNLDVYYEEIVPQGNDIKTENAIYADGMITRYELSDNETRAMFASLNHNGLVNKVIDPKTSYKKYDLKYLYPSDFDGHMSNYSLKYTTNVSKKTYDNRNEEYIKFKFGQNNDGKINYMYYQKNTNDYQFPLFNNSFYFYFGLNEGNTSIDKFNNLFYSSCFKNDKSPFSVFINTVPKGWCDNNGASIEYEVKGIEMPYSIKLYYVLTQEHECYSESNILVKNKKINESNINLENVEVQLLDNNTYPLLNGNYILEIRDNFGNIIKKNISIDPIYLSFNYSYKNLSMRYEEDNSQTIKNEGNGGNIIFDSVNIDGQECTIEDFSCNKTTVSITNSNNQLVENDAYQVNISAKTNNEKVYVIKSIISGTINTNYYEVSYNKNEKTITINIYKPCTIDINSVQMCGDKESFNTNNIRVNITNVSEFIGYINDVPMKLLNNISEVEGYLWDKYVTYKDTTLYKFTDYGIKKQDNKCVFNNEKSIEFYSKYVDLLNTYSSSDGNNVIYEIDDILSILKYQFDCIFTLANKTIIVDDEKSYSIEMSTDGGISPIIYRSISPSLYDVTESENIVCRLEPDGYYSCPITYPDYVNKGWCIYNGDTGQIITWGDGYDKYTDGRNPLLYFNDSGRTYNAFVAFSNNGDGDILPNGVDKGLIDNFDVNKSVPWYYFNEYKGNMFKGYFIDNRFSFNFGIGLKNNSFLGGIAISGQSYSGVKMVYDERHNIIGENLEYNYDSYVISHNNNDNAKFYNSYLLINNENKIDILNYYAEDGKLNRITSPLSEIKNIKFTHQSCSYDIDLSIDNTKSLIGIVKPSEEINFDMNCEDVFSNDIKLLNEEIYEINNVKIVNYDTNEYTPFSGTSRSKLFDGDVEFSINPYKDNNFDGDVFISIPYISINSSSYALSIGNNVFIDNYNIENVTNKFSIVSGDSSYSESIFNSKNTRYINTEFTISDPNSNDTMTVNMTPKYKELCALGLKIKVSNYSDIYSFSYSYKKSYMNNTNNILRKIVIDNNFSIEKNDMVLKNGLNYSIKKVNDDGTDRGQNIELFFIGVHDIKKEEVIVNGETKTVWGIELYNNIAYEGNFSVEDLPNGYRLIFFKNNFNNNYLYNNSGKISFTLAVTFSNDKKIKIKINELQGYSNNEIQAPIIPENPIN